MCGDPLKGVNPELSVLATDQDGLVSSAQIDASTTPWGRRRLLESGWLERTVAGVYKVAGVPETHRFELRRGLLALGEPSWVSFESAASLHRLDRSDDTAIEFTVLRSRRGCADSSIGTIHTSQSVPLLDRVTVDGLPTLSATRTVLDLALARTPDARLEAAIDSAVRLGLSSPSAIERRLRTLRGSGRWGCRLVDTLLDDSGGHSMLERRFLELVRRAGIERPATQVVHRQGDRFVARVDFEWVALGVVVEVSGQLGHAERAGRARDAQRRNELQDLGLLVFEFTYEQVTRRGPWVTGQLKVHLRRAADRLRRV